MFHLAAFLQSPLIILGFKLDSNWFSAIKYINSFRCLLITGCSYWSFKLYSEFIQPLKNYLHKSQYVGFFPMKHFPHINCSNFCYLQALIPSAALSSKLSPSGVRTTSIMISLHSMMTDTVSIWLSIFASTIFDRYY